MKPKDTVRPAVAVALALMLALAGAGGATATVNSVDTSSTDATASTSQVQAQTTIQMNNTSQSHIYQVIATNATVDPVTQVDQNGTVVAENASMTNVGVGSSGTHFNATIAETSLLDVEHAINENVTAYFKAYNNSSTSVVDLNTTVYLKFDDSTTLERVDDGDVGDASSDVATVTDDTFSAFNRNISWGPLHETSADIQTGDRSVNGSQTDVVIALSNTSVKDMFDDGISDASSETKLSSLLRGTRTVAVVSSTDTTVAVPIFYKSAPSSMSESDTYGVYKQVGGTWALDINLGDEFDDASTVSVHAIGSAGRLTLFTQYLGGGMFGFSLPGGVSPLLGLVPMAAGRRRATEVASAPRAEA